MPITAKYNVEGEFTKVKPRIVVADLQISDGQRVRPIRSDGYRSPAGES